MGFWITPFALLSTSWVTAEKRELEVRRKRLELPAIDQAMLAALLANFEHVMAEGTNPQKKHLLHQLVKKVLVHDRRTVEVWYALPNSPSVRTPGNMAPRTSRSTNRRESVAEPEIYFRIVHIALDTRNGAPVAYREQTVEIALGPQGAFENGNIGTLTRQVPASQIVNAVPPPRGKPKLPREPRTPPVVMFLRKALEWQALLASGEATSQSDIAQREGISRIRVCQVMCLLRLAPEIQQHVLSLPETIRQPVISERALRPLARVEDLAEQRSRFQVLIGDPTNGR